MKNSRLKEYLKSFNDGTHFSEEEIENIYVKLINSSNKNISNRQHVKNIRNTQRELKEGLCPRCGGKLISKSGKYGPFFGCENYPKCKFILKKR